MCAPYGFCQQRVYKRVGTKDSKHFDVVVDVMSAYERLDGLDAGCDGDLMSFGVEVSRRHAAAPAALLPCEAARG